MIDPVGSNARCGSEVLRVNELSMTSVDDDAECRLTPEAATALASATIAARGRSQAIRPAAWFLTVPPVESLWGVLTLFDGGRQVIVGGPLRRRRGARARRLQPAGCRSPVGEADQLRFLDRTAVESV